MPHLCHTTVPLLAGIHEHNVVFVIYTSECNPCNPCIMKELLIRTLYSLGSRLMDSMFNIIWCSSKVLKWQNELVECSLTNIMDAASWIRTLQMNSKGKANAWNAIEEAIENPSCQAIYLFTGGLAEGSVEEICSHLKDTKQSCPVHIVQLIENRDSNKVSSQKLLEKVAKVSGGTLQAIDGASCEDKTGCNLGFHHPGSVGNHLGFPSLRDHYTKLFPLGAWAPDTCNTCLRSSIQENLGDCTTNSHHLLKGTRVLARKQTDGYYYLSHIVQKVKNSNEHVLVEFEKCQRSRKGKAPFRRQETPLYDIFHYDDARWQPLSAGDGTLCSMGQERQTIWPRHRSPSSRKFRLFRHPKCIRFARAFRKGQWLPGISFISGYKREGKVGTKNSLDEMDLDSFQYSKVLINFWNGQTKTISADVAVRISLPLYDRIVLELQMPLRARQMLVEQNPDYPSVVPPGYRASGACRHKHLTWMPWPQTQKSHCNGVCGSNTHFPPSSFCCPQQNHSTSSISSTWADDTWIAKVSSSKEELSKKFKDQLSIGRPPTLENDMDTKGDCSKLKKKTNLADAKSWEENETNVAEPSEDQKVMDSEDTTNNTGTMVDITTNAGKWMTQPNQKFFLQPNLSGSSTQLSQRNASQKTYLANNSKLQAKLDWVDKSLKKDRVAIESVLHMRRSYSAPPSGQKLLEKEAPWDSPREVDANPMKIDFKRQKWEQRQLRKEQQQQEIHLKREMQLENKSQQSLQRTLQSSQRLQEQSERAERHLEQLRGAKTERRRQESHFQEEEGKKENQRREFLKEQHKQREKQLAKHNRMIDGQEKEALLRNRKEVRQNNAEIALKEQIAENKKKEAVKRQLSHKREQVLQTKKERMQMQKGLLQYLREHDLLLLHASMLP